MEITGRLVAAARALAGVGRADFAAAAGISVERLMAIETKGSAWIASGTEVAGLLEAFERFGIVPLEEDGTMGAGIRLKFTRQDVRQIARLEGEGGIVGADDNP